MYTENLQKYISVLLQKESPGNEFDQITGNLESPISSFDQLKQVLSLTMSTLQTIFNNRHQQFKLVQETIKILLAFLNTGLGEFTLICKKLKNEDIKSVMAGLKTKENSREHRLWYSAVKSQILKKRENQDQDHRTAKNFLHMVEEIKKNIENLNSLVDRE